MESNGRWGRRLAVDAAFALIILVASQRLAAAEPAAIEPPEPESESEQEPMGRRRPRRGRQVVALVLCVLLAVSATGAAAADDVLVDGGDFGAPAASDPPPCDGVDVLCPADEVELPLILDCAELSECIDIDLPENDGTVECDGVEIPCESEEPDPDPECDDVEIPCESEEPERDGECDPQVDGDPDCDDEEPTTPVVDGPLFLGPLTLPPGEPSETETTPPDELPAEELPPQSGVPTPTNGPRTLSRPQVRPAEEPTAAPAPSSPPAGTVRPPIRARARALVPANPPEQVAPAPAPPTAPPAARESASPASTAEPGVGVDPDEDDDEEAAAGPSTTPGAAALPGLTVRTMDGQTTGPPGSLLRIAATDHGACDTAFFFLAGRRIGSGRPDAAGNVLLENVSAPAAVGPGAQQVTSSCSRSGVPEVRIAEFVVSDAALHRTSLTTSLTRPDQVLLDPANIARSVAIVLLLLLLVAWPAELFNDTLEENYDEVRGWVRRGPRDPARPPSRARTAAVFAAFTVALAVLYGLLEPGYGFDRSSIALTIGLMVGLTAVMGALALPELLYKRPLGDRGRLQVLPPTLLVALACVAMSRVVGFEPGYLYGGLAAFVFTIEVRKDVEGRLAAASAVTTLLLGVAAWFAWSAVSVRAGRVDAGFGLLALEATLAATFAAAIESAAFIMFPMRFMFGGRVMGWSRKVWAAIFAISMLFFVHVIVRPNAGYVSEGAEEAMALVVAGVVGFALFSFSFWAYFRFRPEHRRGRSSAEGDGADVAVAPIV